MNASRQVGNPFLAATRAAGPNDGHVYELAEVLRAWIWRSMDRRSERVRKFWISEYGIPGKWVVRRKGEPRRELLRSYLIIFGVGMLEFANMDSTMASVLKQFRSCWRSSMLVGGGSLSVRLEPLERLMRYMRCRWLGRVSILATEILYGKRRSWTMLSMDLFGIDMVEEHSG